MLNITTKTTSNFTRLDNEFLHSPKLSIKAKGLLAQILSFPPTWELSISGLTKIFSDGKYAIGTAFKELICAGYIVSYSVQNASGCYCTPKYGISEVPVTGENREQLLEKLAAAPSNFNVFRKEKTSNFTIISNKIFQNNTLSMQAKGMLCVVISLPNKWKLSANGLTTLCSNGISCINSTLAKLTNAGFLERQMSHNGKGRFQESVYNVDSNGNFAVKRVTREKLPAQTPKKITTREEVEEMVEYKTMVKAFPKDTEKLTIIVNIVTETLNSSEKFQRIGQGNMLTDTVKERFKGIERATIESVLKTIAQPKMIKNVKNYILTALYNATILDSLYHKRQYELPKGSYGDPCEMEKVTSSFNVDELDEMDLERYRKITPKSL